LWVSIRLSWKRRGGRRQSHALLLPGLDDDICSNADIEVDIFY
jgi:hypothetical protein